MAKKLVKKVGKILTSAQKKRLARLEETNRFLAELDKKSAPTKKPTKPVKKIEPPKQTAKENKRQEMAVSHLAFLYDAGFTKEEVCRMYDAVDEVWHRHNG